MITFIPLGGLANRYYAIISILSFCLDHNVKLRIMWFKDWGMGADFKSIFEYTSKNDHIKIVDAGWCDYLYDRPRKRNFWIPALFQRAIFTERIYEEDVFNERFSVDRLREAVELGKSIYLVHCNLFYTKDGMFQLLSPTNYIKELIEERKNLLNIDNNMIGIHIRRTDHIDSILNSPLSLFISKIKEEIERNSSVRFYVASDDLGEKVKLKNLFGDRIVSIFEKVSRDNIKGIQDALVELYTLSSMSKIYGSCKSTFSQLAADLSGKQLEILTVK
jgi:hypothetical protein